MRSHRLPVLACLAAFGAVSACSAASPAQSPSSSATAGTTATGYRSVTDGAVLRIQGTASHDFPALGTTARITVVNLWAQWCGPCREEAPVLRAAQARLAPEGVEFVGVDTEDDQSQANSFARVHGWTWPQFYDENGLTLHTADFAGLPDTLILGPGGRIEGTYSGPVTNLSAFVKTVSGLARHA